MAIKEFKIVFSQYHQGSSSFIHLLSSPTVITRDAAIHPDDPEKLKAATDRSAKNISTKLVFHGSHNADKALQLNQLAKHTKQHVCFIDCKGLVENYIGETEKNLSRLVAQAETENWILYFDEADALFGSRTDVKSAHDKYVNQDVSDFFKRLSQYSGLSILSMTEKPKLDIIQYAVDNVVSFR